MVNSLGKTIRILRQAKEMKLGDLATVSGISVPFLSLIESGDRQPSLDVLRRLAKGLDIPSEALVLLGMGSDADLQSTDSTVQKIASSVRDLMHVEEALRLVLGPKKAASERERNRPRGRRRGHGA